MSSGATEFTTRDDPALGPGARVYRLSCDHGVSSALLLDTTRRVSDSVVLDWLLIGHHRSRQCECVPTPSLGHPADAHARPAVAHGRPALTAVPTP